MNPVGQYRVLKRTENVGWRDARPEETTMYHAMVRYRILQWLEPFVSNGLYGSVFKDGKFRIHDLRKTDLAPGTTYWDNFLQSYTEEEEGGKVDVRNKPRGRECNESWAPGELIMVARALGTPLPADARSAAGLSLSQLRDELAHTPSST